MVRSDLFSYIAKDGIISEYLTVNEEGPRGRMRCILNHVTFSPQFVESLKRRLLFEVD